MKISIVIPNWNGAGKLKRNLPTVLRVARQSDVSEVIVSDDASSDNSVEVLRTKFPDVILIESTKEKNLGFSSNVNIGVRKASGELVVLLNNDAIPSNDFLKYTLPHFKNPQVFSVGCNSGGLWATAEFKDGFFRHGQTEKSEVGDQAHQTLWVSGGSGIFRKDMWDEMGGLDTLYNPFYVEDLDLGYRAWKRGFINLWEPRSKVSHYHEKGVIESNFSRSTVRNTAERNMLIFIWKNITSEKLISEHRKALIKRLFSHPRYWLVFLASLKNLPEIMNKRGVEKKAAVLSDEDVLRIFS